MFFDPLPLLLVCAGIYLLIKLRAFYILHPFRSFGEAFGYLKDPENLRSFTLALAGTLGVGNVLGVAVGLTVGGRGSVLWLFISAIPASVLKYSECALASSRAKDDRGGMFYCIRDLLGRPGATLSVIYAVACFLLSLVMGASIQTRTVVDSAALCLGVPSLTVATASVALVLISIVGGGKIIKRITSVCIPITTIIYIIVAVSMVFSSRDRLPDVLHGIWNDAFSPLAGVGGALGLLTSRALSEGFARGMLSNEAGAGTSSLGHTSGGAASHRVKGLFGVLEVFFDTTVLCMLTALAILVTVDDISVYHSGMELVMHAASVSLGKGAAITVFISVLSFAYSTVICWYYYGGECIRQLTGRSSRLFLPLYLLFVFLGGFVFESLLIALADALLLVLTLLTLPTLIKSSDRLFILSELDKYDNKG
ncbi:MAG: sodium:alanine symporter family protein [Clostridia bacterium]|nr:sodium:alanine symporter family protein [Clostridia bacterium]